MKKTLPSLNAVSSVLLSSISFIITFEQEKVIFDTQNSLLWKYIVEDLAHNQLLDDAAVRFAKLFGNQHNQPSVTEYKIVNDSLLYLFNNQENKFEKYGILRKMSENYDYLKCIISTQKESYAPIELTMRKIQK